MRSIKLICGHVAFAALALTVLAGCGGGGTSAPQSPGQGVGNLPGTQMGSGVGNNGGGASGGGGGGVSTGQVVIGNGVATDVAVLPKAQKPGTTDMVNAPLGTNPAYNMQVVEPQVTDIKTGSRTGSLVAPGGTADRLEIIDLTMVADGAAPDWNISSNSFHEGQQIDMYIKYYSDSGIVVNPRHWDAQDINVNLDQASINHATSGEYTVKLDSYATFGKVGTGYKFWFSLKRTYNGSPQTLKSSDFIYSITAATPGTYTTRYPLTGDAQIAYEDLLTNSDYDYNDFVCYVNMTEWRMEGSNDLGQITMRVKAKARVAGYSSDYQFNISSAFPGATVHATVKQYYANGTVHGSPVNWTSSQGADLPIFTPTKQALPGANGSYQANGIAGTPFVDGDYADITIIFDNPVPAGTWDAMPYNPLLRVDAGGGNIYKIGIWQHKGDTVDSEGHQLVDSSGRPLAFVVPNTYAWPLEGVQAWNCYSGYNTWATWIKNTNQSAQEPTPKWWTQTPSNMSLVYTRDKFTPWP